jgi:hypothetical protein
MIDRNDYLWYSSEIKALEAILGDIPEECAIERLGYESRLEEARAAVEGVSAPPARRLRLTFRGEPVMEAHGIRSDFVGQALNIFTDTVKTIQASLKGKLNPRGPIPESQQNPLLVVGSAIGSFGFELELPGPPDAALVGESDAACESIKKIQAIFQAVAQGSDEDLSEVIGEVHPRAIDKVHDFLSHQAQHKARCCLDFDGRHFLFQSDEQIQSSADRLARGNITEEEATLEGTLIGVLPSDRRFELETEGGDIKKGRTHLTLEDGKRLWAEYSAKAVKVRVRAVSAGRGSPRYILESLEDVASATG